jgi:predicted DNA binding CopG/RHH family protein
MLLQTQQPHSSMNQVTFLKVRLSEPLKAKFDQRSKDIKMSASELMRSLIIQEVSHMDASSHELTEEIPSKKERQVVFRLNMPDHMHLKQLAKAQGMTANAYASLIVRNQISDTEPATVKELQQLEASNYELMVLGRSLQQSMNIYDDKNKNQEHKTTHQNLEKLSKTVSHHQARVESLLNAIQKRKS